MGMLVITRKSGESFVLKHEGKVIATVTLVNRMGDTKARIGIDALPEIAVVRSELLAGSSNNGDQSVNR